MGAHLRKALVPFVLAALVLVAGCTTTHKVSAGRVPDADLSTASANAGSTASDTSDSTDTSDGTDSTESSDASSSAAPSTLALVDAGAEPRFSLRLKVTKGDAQEITLRQVQHQKISAGGQTQEATLPAVEFDITYAPVSVAKDRIGVDVEYGATRLDEGGAADESTRSTLEDILSSFEGAVGHATYDGRGRLLELQPPDVMFPPSFRALGETLIQGISDQAVALAVPLPAEPVGAGAHWRVTGRATLGGIPVHVTSDVLVDSVSATSVEAHLQQTVELVAGPTTIAGQTATIEGGSLTGTGTLSWDLTEVAPITDITIDGSTSITAGGVHLEQTQHLKMTMSRR